MTTPADHIDRLLQAMGRAIRPRFALASTSILDVRSQDQGRDGYSGGTTPPIELANRAELTDGAG